MPTLQLLMNYKQSLPMQYQLGISLVFHISLYWMAFAIPDDMTAETGRHSRRIKILAKPIVCIFLIHSLKYAPCNQTFRNRVSFKGSACCKLPNFIKSKHLMPILNAGSTLNGNDARYKWICKAKNIKKHKLTRLVKHSFLFSKESCSMFSLWFNNDGSTIRKHENSYCGWLIVCRIGIV